MQLYDAKPVGSVMVTIADGCTLGIDVVGFADGCLEGNRVGPVEGTALGETEGLAEGLVVGDPEGTVVVSVSDGKGDGAAVTQMLAPAEE